MNFSDHTAPDSPLKKSAPQDNYLEEHKLYDRDFDHESCGVGFITRKDGKQTHDLMLKGHESLCVIPHRGGMSSEGIGDGAGINMDISCKFFAKIAKFSSKIQFPKSFLV